RRLWFATADAVTTQRLADGPAHDDPAAHEDALLDQLLIRIELLFEKQKDAEKNALVSAEAIPEGPRHELAKRAVEGASGGEKVFGDGGPAPEVPPDASPRWKLLHDVLELRRQDGTDG